MQAVVVISPRLDGSVLHGSGDDKTRLRQLAVASGLAINTDIGAVLSRRASLGSPSDKALLPVWTRPESKTRELVETKSRRRRSLSLVIPSVEVVSEGGAADGARSPLSQEQVDVEGLVRARERHMDHTFKILVVGDPGVGKTSMVQRFVHGYYTKDYKATLGVDFALKLIPWSDQVTIKLQLWDIAGQERFTAMTRVYYRDAHACVIMFDLTQRSSFLNAAKWKTDLDTKCLLPDGAPLPCILLANKMDLKQREVDQEEMESFCREQNFIGWTETSVKSGHMVDQSMRFLLNALMERHSPESVTEDRALNTIALSQYNTPDHPPDRAQCSCDIL